MHRRVGSIGYDSGGGKILASVRDILSPHKIARKGRWIPKSFPQFVGLFLERAIAQLIAGEQGIGYLGVWFLGAVAGAA